MTNRSYNRLRKIVFTWKEIAGHGVGRVAEERPPGGVEMAGSRPVAAGTQDPPYGCLADVVTEPGEFAVRSAVSPGRVLPR
jgi:hypothetical protein